MVWIKRITLLLVVNILVVVTISLILNLLGIRPYLSARGIDYQASVSYTHLTLPTTERV